MSDLAKIKDYVVKNKIPAKEGFICVDGRYPKNSEYSGMLARPGGNFKGILTCLALKDKTNLTIGRCVDKGVGAIESMGYTFNMHTDEHTNADDFSAIGCGHIAKAADPAHASDYGVDPEDVKKALMYLKIKLEGRGYYKMVDLEGHHQEEGVLIITGDKYTVNHYDPTLNQMYFVYDQKRDQEFSKRLFDRFEIPNITFEEFQEVGEKQLSATLSKLAKGLPIYEVNVDTDTPEIKYMGNVS